MITFHEIYERHSKDVYRYSYWLSGSAQDADDITSETFARAWVGREQIRTETVKAYLFTIARNLYLKGLRHIKRQADLDPRQADPKPAPEQLVESRLELDHAMQVIQSLPEIDRAAFLLRVQHELPYDEIARTLQLSLTSVKVKIHRARLKLAAHRIGDNE
ncbi:MAG TPA: RNA polymerase sigma factor [Anaerolineales bacterium]|nr:RNA polymerase sigma factor [Anaerolineales bacterium]